MSLRRIGNVTINQVSPALETIASEFPTWLPNPVIDGGRFAHPTAALLTPDTANGELKILPNDIMEDPARNQVLMIVHSFYTGAIRKMHLFRAPWGSDLTKTESWTRLTSHAYPLVSPTALKWDSLNTYEGSGAIKGNWLYMAYNGSAAYINNRVGLARLNLATAYAAGTPDAYVATKVTTNAPLGLGLNFTATPVHGSDWFTGSAGDTYSVTTSAADVVTATAGNHQLVTGQPVAFSGTIDANLLTTVVYYWIKIDASTGKVATSIANAIAGTAIDLAGDATSHTMTVQKLPNGLPVVLQVSAGGAMPTVGGSPAFTASTVYYVTGLAPNSYQLEASVGGGAITFDGNGSGTLTVYACQGYAPRLAILNGEFHLWVSQTGQQAYIPRHFISLSFDQTIGGTGWTCFSKMKQYGADDQAYARGDSMTGDQHVSISPRTHDGKSWFMIMNASGVPVLHTIEFEDDRLIYRQVSQLIALGADDAWDDHAFDTPCDLYHNGEHYLFYTGQGSRVFTVPDHTNDKLHMVAHPHATGDAVTVTHSGAGDFPTYDGGQLAANTIYFVIKDGADDVKLADTYAHAIAGTALDITSSGGGTLSLITTPRTGVAKYDFTANDISSFTTVRQDYLYHRSTTCTLGPTYNGNAFGATNGFIDLSTQFTEITNVALQEVGTGGYLLRAISDAKDLNPGKFRIKMAYPTGVGDNSAASYVAPDVTSPATITAQVVHYRVWGKPV